jgi:hypothetical protein
LGIFNFQSKGVPHAKGYGTYASGVDVLNEDSDKPWAQVIARGPGGGGMRPEWGMKAAMDHMENTWAWMTGMLAGNIDTTAFKLEVTEYDWSKVYNVIYEDNGVVIRSIPAIHFEGTATFILEYNGPDVNQTSFRLIAIQSLPNNFWAN